MTGCTARGAGLRTLAGPPRCLCGKCAAGVQRGSLALWEARVDAGGVVAKRLLYAVAQLLWRRIRQEVGQILVAERENG